MDESSSFLKTVSPDRCRLFLETGCRGNLWEAFQWNLTPQGGEYWCDVSDGKRLPTDSDILLIESWIIEATFSQ
jgi:hypothetical protein